MSDLQLLAEGRLTAVCCWVEVVQNNENCDGMICMILYSSDDGMAGYS